MYPSAAFKISFIQASILQLPTFYDWKKWPLMQWSGEKLMWAQLFDQFSILPDIESGL